MHLQLRLKGDSPAENFVADQLNAAFAGGILIEMRDLPIDDKTYRIQMEIIVRNISPQILDTLPHSLEGKLV